MELDNLVTHYVAQGLPRAMTAPGTPTTYFHTNTSLLRRYKFVTGGRTLSVIPLLALQTDDGFNSG